MSVTTGKVTAGLFTPRFVQNQKPAQRAGFRAGIIRTIVYTVGREL